jgi:hypothetical protein
MLVQNELRAIGEFVLSKTCRRPLVELHKGFDVIEQAVQAARGKSVLRVGFHLHDRDVLAKSMVKANASNSTILRKCLANWKPLFIEAGRRSVESPVLCRYVPYLCRGTFAKALSSTPDFLQLVENRRVSFGSFGKGLAQMKKPAEAG